MYPVFYCHEFNKCDLESNGRSLEKKFNELITDLEKNKNTNLGDVKLISGSGGIKFLRAKLSDKDRLLFTSIKYNNKGAFVILEVILDHRYDKSKFLTQKEKIENIKILDKDSNEVSDNTGCKVEVVNAPQVPWLGKFITFSATQEEIVKSADDLPLIVSGSAGSGKTSVALEKLRKIEEEFKEGKILYITQSESLIKKSKELYEYEHYDQDENKPKIGIPRQIEFLSVHAFLEKVTKEDVKKCVEGKKPINRSAFFSWFKEICKKKNFCEHKKDGDKIFEEFSAVIAGRRLTKEKYKELGNRQAVFPKGGERGKIYALFEEYKKFIKENSEYYDTNIIAYQEQDNKVYDTVVVDEVQDLTESTLELILKSLKEESKSNFLLCGDANQVIHPSFFSISRLEFFLREYNSSKVCVLEKNYRNSKQVIELANRILHLKNYCFASEDKMKEEEKKLFFMESDTEDKGNVSFIAQDKKQKMAKEMPKSINWAVLALDDEKKEEACKLFDTPLVFNVHEAKGLEFENVILYKFMSDKAYDEIYDIVCPDKKNQKSIEGAIAKVYHSYDQKDLNSSRAKDKQDKSFVKYKFYMNALYVAVTRANKNVYIIDSRKQRNLWEVVTPDVGITNIKKEESSPEEWKIMALELIDRGNIEQARKIAEKLQLIGETKYAQEIMNALEPKQAISELKTEPQKSSTMVSNEKREQNPSKKKELKQNELLMNTIRDDKIDELKKIDLSQYNTQQMLELAFKSYSLKTANYLINNKGFTLENTKFLSASNREAIFLEAAQFGYGSIVKLFLEHGTDVNARIGKGPTSLHLAVEGNYEDMAKLILQYKPDINVGDIEDLTPLHYAVEDGHVNMVKLLLQPQYKADVNAKNNVGNTPLQLARIKGNKNIVQLLLEHGAKQNKNENQEDGIEVFMSKLRNNEAIDKLKKAGVSHYDTQQVLMDIICNDKIDELKKIDISQYDKKHILEFSLQKSAFKITEFLIKDKGFTPKNSDFSVGHLGGDDFALLLQACQYGFFSVAKFLLHYQSDYSKNLLLPWAAKEYHSGVVKLLNSGNAKLGSTPLYEAARKGKEDLALLHKEVVNLFLADSSINIGHVKAKDFTIGESQLRFLDKLQQDNALFNKVKEVAEGKNGDKLLREIEDLLNKKSKYGFKPSLNYSPDGSNENTTIKIAIKAGGKLLQLLYDYAKKNIDKDTEIFKQLKHAKEHENTQPKSDVSNVSVSGNLIQAQGFKLGGA